MKFPDIIQAKTIFQNVFILFGMLSPDGSVIELEGKIFERTATDPELLIGQKFAETVYWQSSEQSAQQVENALAEAVTGKNTKIYVGFRVSASEIIPVQLYLQPLFDEDVNSNRIFFCAQANNDREKEVEFFKTQSEQLLYAAENANIGLWYWDLQNDKINSTPKCNELFEISPYEEITFDSFLKIVHPEDRERVENALIESQTYGRDYNSEYRVIYSDGNVHWIAAQGKTYLDSDGNPKNMMGVVRKVTDKKIASEELSKVYALEKKARDDAEEANRAKDFFLAIVSHELRSPLNAILGWSKILLTKEVDEKTRINALETIEKSARSQAKLIEDLVDSARVASGKLRLELRTVNLYEIIKNVYNSQRPTAELRNITLELVADDENIQVYGDSTRLQQIFTNLLTNSLKFTENGGKIQIISDSTKSVVKVSIKDNGQGISQEFIPNIFRQFRQGNDNTSLSQTGLGLGLSIVKILVEKHQGTVQAESEGIGHGSTFTVVLPTCGSQTNVSKEIKQSIPQKGNHLEGVKVLIVEDDLDSREVLQLFLEQNGAKVRSAESAREALTLLRESEDDLPDVIVSDLAMPNEDGYSLISRIRQLAVADGGDIPALALSAFASKDNKQKAFDSGFQKYHTKPFEPDVIVEDILYLLNKNKNAD